MAQATAPILDSTETDQSARSDDVRSSGAERTLREWFSTSESDPEQSFSANSTLAA